jgi:flavodoxin
MFLVSYTGMLSKAIGAKWQHHGPLGKVERLIFIMVFSVLEYLQITGKISKFYEYNYFEWLMILFVILGQVTVFNRLVAQIKECKKLDWIKYRNINKKTIVIYDSQTGNTEKIANEIADSMCAEIKKVNEVLNEDLSYYDLVVLATPHLGRKIMSFNMVNFLENEHNIKKYAIATTSGMPIKRHFSNKKCIKYFISKLNKKPVKSINIKGYHSIAKTYSNRPNEVDLLDAYLFGIKLLERI